MRSVKKKLAAIRIEIDSPHPNITQRTVRSLLDYIADLERQRATVRAAAIQAVSIKLHKMCTVRGGEANGTLTAREIEIALRDIVSEEL